MSNEFNPKLLYGALFDALAEGRAFNAILVSDLAQNADQDVAICLDFSTTALALFGQFSRALDRKVLSGLDGSMTDEPSRERLFDTLMTRLDFLLPYQAGLNALFQQAKRDPALAIMLNGIALRSMAMVLDSSGISASGLRGAVRVQALSIGFVQVLNVWFDDHAPDYPKTMATLDRILKRGESLFGTLERVMPSRSGDRVSEPELKTSNNQHEGSQDEPERSAD